MNARAGFVWATKQHFNRYIEECGVGCDLITPHMLAAPFFRPVINCLIIPTGFANPAYSNILPALRASSARLCQYIENGGHVLVFGAAMDKPDAYDWLPFSVVYHHDFHPRAVICQGTSDTTGIIDDFDASGIECDGSFPSHDADCIASSEDTAVLLEKHIGKGKIVITSIHEFPSRRFLQTFCEAGLPVQF